MSDRRNPIRRHVIKSYPRPKGTAEGFWNQRLNVLSKEELPGGFGFCLPPEPDDRMFLETRAKRR